MRRSEISRASGAATISWRCVSQTIVSVLASTQAFAASGVMICSVQNSSSFRTVTILSMALVSFESTMRNSLPKVRAIATTPIIPPNAS